MCGVNIVSFMLLAECCELTGKFSYLEIGRVAFGPLFGTIAQVRQRAHSSSQLSIRQPLSYLFTPQRNQDAKPRFPAHPT